MRDLDEVFAALAGSGFRSKFRLGEKEARYLLERGLEVVGGQARELIDQRLAGAAPLNDGKQTPWRGHPVFVAQHATGTCCRSCLLKWHGVPKGRELSESERGYVVAVICRWLGLQELPGALHREGEGGSQILRVRRSTASAQEDISADRSVRERLKGSGRRRRRDLPEPPGLFS